jgi:ribonuclease T2
MGSPKQWWVVAASIACLLLADLLDARYRKRPSSAAKPLAYYLLALSYAPNFCAQPQGNQDPRECGAGGHVGFVVHGLWPEGENARPEFCGPASPVSQAILQATLGYIPTESLVQHEWAAHGTCSGLSAAGYFAALRKARDAVTLPVELKQPSQRFELTPGEIEAKMAAENPGFPQSAFRTSCYRDGELEEVRVCLTKDLAPRACGRSAGECSESRVTLLPVR